MQSKEPVLEFGQAREPVQSKEPVLEFGQAREPVREFGLVKAPEHVEPVLE